MAADGNISLLSSLFQPSTNRYRSCVSASISGPVDISGGPLDRRTVDHCGRHQLTPSAVLGWDDRADLRQTVALNGGASGSTTTSVSLLCRIQTFAPTAWARLVDLYGPLVYRWCIRARLQPADAADVGQEVFGAVAQAITRFRHDRQGDSFRGWLYTITRNKIRDLANARRHVVAIGGYDALRGLEGIPAPSDALNDAPGCNDREELVRRAVEMVRGDFEPGTWAAFWRSVVDGLSADDVAVELGMTRNAVYLAKARVRRRLADEFAGLIDLAESEGDTREANVAGDD